ncbi:hypothetical protein DERP_002677 [Dermatophagoides pteronyssinus]|uniref:Uncharacterized protein n=1 Tax=Dermatophagoides pteronyssinus TaxID=6956 RepID=A0ABQ8JVF2_DERPT|nr:hypothetical protein DERP_002677 [Dermatophagoides pteronyssinus]
MATTTISALSSSSSPQKMDLSSSTTLSVWANDCWRLSPSKDN